MKHLTKAVIAASILLSACSDSNNKRIALKEHSSNLEQSDTELSLYEEIETACSDELYSACRKKISKFKALYSLSSKIGQITLLEAESHYHSSNFLEAIAIYGEFIKNFPKHNRSDYAQLMLAKSYLSQYNDELREQEPIEMAAKNLKKLLELYPESEHVEETERKLLEIWQKTAEHEYQVATYYLEAGQLESAAYRLAIVRNLFPNSNADKDLNNLFSTMNDNRSRRLLSLLELQDVKNYNSPVEFSRIQKTLNSSSKLK